MIARRVAEMISVSDEFVRKVRKELVKLGQLPEVETVVAADGREQSATYKPSPEPIPTVGIESGGVKNDEPQIPEHEPEESANEPEAPEPDSDPTDGEARAEPGDRAAKR